MSNLWLNPKLVKSAKLTEKTGNAILAELEETLPLGVESRRDDYALLQHAHRADRRRFLIQALSILFLLGSAAFSYLAWSDSLASFESRPQATAAAAAKKASLVPLQNPDLERIVSLREENRRLHEQLASVTQTLAELPPAQGSTP